MKPNLEHIKIDKNLEKIKQFINEIIIQPKHTLTQWAKITKQTPAAKIGYIGQHLASLVTGVQGTGSGARGDDLADGSEIKSCSKIDQADKCKDCGARVLRIERECSVCGSKRIGRKNDSKWLFSVRDEHELNQYLNLDRVVLLLMDYPNFDKKDYNDIRIVVFEIYPKDERMQVFKELITNHYYNIYLPKLEAKKKTNPMNLHPWGIQFYKCNPIKTFECKIKDVDGNPEILIDADSYIGPARERDNSIKPLPMPSTLLKPNEWEEMLSKADFENEVAPLISPNFMQKKKLAKLTEHQFSQLSSKAKAEALPYLDQKLRDYISLRPIISVTQEEHYQRD